MGQRTIAGTDFLEVCSHGTYHGALNQGNVGIGQQIRPNSISNLTTAILVGRVDEVGSSGELAGYPYRNGRGKKPV